MQKVSIHLSMCRLYAVDRKRRISKIYVHVNLKYTDLKCLRGTREKGTTTPLRVVLCFE